MFEYMVMSTSDNMQDRALETSLSKMSAEGWRLVAVVATRDPDDDNRRNCLTHYFERAKKPNA